MKYPLSAYPPNGIQGCQQGAFLLTGKYLYQNILYVWGEINNYFQSFYFQSFYFQSFLGVYNAGGYGKGGGEKSLELGPDCCFGAQVCLSTGNSVESRGQKHELAGKNSRLKQRAF